MPWLPIYEWLGLDLSERTKTVINVVGLAVAGFVATDAVIAHGVIWENDPAIWYWLAKPVWVGVPMAAVAWWLRRSGRGLGTSLLAGALAGVVSLQLYYTVVPVPIDGGPAVQVGLVGNLTEGLVVHLGALALALGAALYARQWWVGGE